MDSARNVIPFLKSQENKYDVVYVNTPWKKLDSSKISKFPVNEITKENSALFLWVDTYSAGDAMNLLTNWGYTFHSVYQVADLGQYEWMKTLKENSKSKTPVTDVVHEETEEKEDEKDKKKPRASRKYKMPTVVPAVWWSSEPEKTFGTRSTTEQLWLAVKGDVTEIFDESHLPSSQVVNLPELGKKNKPKKKSSGLPIEEWDTDRPSSFLDGIVEKLTPGKKILSAFSSTSIHQTVDSWGPGVPGGFSCAFNGTSGLVPAIGTTMRTMKKTQLSMLAGKLSKYTGSDVVAKYEIMKNVSPTWDCIMKTVTDGDFGYSCGYLDTDNLPEEWLVYLFHVVAHNTVANLDKGRKRKKQKSSGDRIRRGINSPSDISTELSEFFEIPVGEKMARTTAVSKLNKYIKEKNLQDPANKIQIVLDPTLTKLLDPPADFGPVTFFNLCVLLGKHFVKKNEPETVDEPVEKKPKVN